MRIKWFKTKQPRYKIGDKVRFLRMSAGSSYGDVYSGEIVKIKIGIFNIKYIVAVRYDSVHVISEKHIIES